MKNISVLKCFIIILLTVSNISIQAQVKKKIKKTRRNNAQSEYALAKSDLLIEAEFGNEIINKNLSTASLPSIALHLGITNRLEINTSLNYVNAVEKNDTEKTLTHGFEPLNIGVNYLIGDRSKKRPAVIASFQLAFPSLASSNFLANHVAPAMQLSFQQQINKKIGFTITPGFFFDGFSTTPAFTYFTGLSYKANDNIQLSTDFSGFVGKDSPQHNFNIGVDFAATKQWTIGLTTGFGLLSASHKNYTGLSLGYLLSKKGKSSK